MNYRIETLEYCVEDKRYKLCLVVKSSKKLSGGACQLWNFLRLFPLLISDKIEDINENSCVFYYSLR